MDQVRLATQSGLGGRQAHRSFQRLAIRLRFRERWELAMRLLGSGEARHGQALASSHQIIGLHQDMFAGSAGSFPTIQNLTL